MYHENTRSKLGYFATYNEIILELFFSLLKYIYYMKLLLFQKNNYKSRMICKIMRRDFKPKKTKKTNNHPLPPPKKKNKPKNPPKQIMLVHRNDISNHSFRYGRYDFEYVWFMFCDVSKF